jgi:hypothetical protein
MGNLLNHRCWVHANIIFFSGRTPSLDRAHDDEYYPTRRGAQLDWWFSCGQSDLLDIPDTSILDDIQKRPQLEQILCEQGTGSRHQSPQPMKCKRRDGNSLLLWKQPPVQSRSASQSKVRSYPRLLIKIILIPLCKCPLIRPHLICFVSSSISHHPPPPAVILRIQISSLFGSIITP